MDFNTSYNKIVTDENMMEMIQHGDRDYPFQLYYDDLALFDFHCVEWHWHVGFEFVLIETGTVTFGIGEKQVTLEKGHGVFINSKILHRYYSDGHAVVPNFVVDPDFLAAPESLIYKKYVQPIQKSALNGLIFSPDIAWQAEAISVMRDIVAAQDSEKDVELVTSFLMQRLWHLIYLNTEEKYLTQKDENPASEQARLQMMMQYIHENYDRKLCLENIADQAMISKSTALNLFRSYLDDTPVHYLLWYRLQEAAKLLITTEKKITVIAQSSGFENVEYFCKSFKKHYQMTPTEYRRKKQLPIKAGSVGRNIYA